MKKLSPGIAPALVLSLAMACSVTLLSGCGGGGAAEGEEGPEIEEFADPTSPEAMESTLNPPDDSGAAPTATP